MLKQLDIHVNQNLEQILTDECASHETKKRLPVRWKLNKQTLLKFF